MWQPSYQISSLLAKTYFTILCLILAICLFNQSRAFSLGYIAAIGIFSYQCNIANCRDILRKPIVIGSTLLIIVAAFFLKFDSSMGRLLIYKINTDILKEHFLWGVGFNQFGIVYPQYQLQYFSKGDFSQKELLLADNVRYAFNDYLQFIIETGFLGFIATILFLIFIIRLYFKASKIEYERRRQIIRITATIDQLHSHIIYPGGQSGRITWNFILQRTFTCPKVPNYYRQYQDYIIKYENVTPYSPVFL